MCFGVWKSGSPRPIAITSSSPDAISSISVRNDTSFSDRRAACWRINGDGMDGPPGSSEAGRAGSYAAHAVDVNAGDALERAEIGARIAVDDHDVGDLAGLERAELGPRAR